MSDSDILAGLVRHCERMGADARKANRRHARSPHYDQAQGEEWATLWEERARVLRWAQERLSMESDDAQSAAPWPGALQDEAE